MAHGKNWRSWPFDIPGWLLQLFDPLAHSLTTIDEEHRLVHDGMLFDCDHIASGIANGSQLDIHLKVPAGCYPHLRHLHFAVSDGPCTFYLYEGATCTGDGTPMSARNHNRNSSNTAQLEVFHTPTVSAVGTAIHSRYVPDMGGVGSNLTGIVGDAQSAQEFVLKPSTSYLLRMVNNSGGAVTIGGECLWYELTYVDSNA